MLDHGRGQELLVKEALHMQMASSDFGCMLSVGTIHFEDRFCASTNVGTGGGGWVHRFG